MGVRAVGWIPSPRARSFTTQTVSRRKYEVLVWDRGSRSGRLYRYTAVPVQVGNTDYGWVGYLC